VLPSRLHTLAVPLLLLRKNAPSNAELVARRPGGMVPLVRVEAFRLEMFPPLPTKAPANSFARIPLGGHVVDHLEFH